MDPLPTQIIRPKKLRLYNALKIGYFRNEDKQRRRLKRFGYRLDPELTTREHMVAFNPNTKKLLFVSNGTGDNSADLANDLLIGLGTMPRENKRVLEQKTALLKAKEKYDAKRAVIVGHSLGGNTSHYIGGENDRIISYNPALINQKERPNEKILKTKNDPVSALANNATVIPGTDNIGFTKAHKLENIKNLPVFL